MTTRQIKLTIAIILMLSLIFLYLIGQPHFLQHLPLFVRIVSAFVLYALLLWLVADTSPTNESTELRATLIKAIEQEWNHEGIDDDPLTFSDSRDLPPVDDPTCFCVRCCAIRYLRETDELYPPIDPTIDPRSYNWP